MEYRNLGNSGVKVSSLCFGAMTFGEADEKSFMHKVGSDVATSHALLDRALAAGINFIDTADVYGQDGLSERVLGEWFAKDQSRRNKVVLATKFRFTMGETANKSGASRYRIVRCVEDSLRRLQTDRIDLYQAHTDDTETPLGETLGAFADLIKAGKVRAVGASNYSAVRLKQALDISARLSLPRYETLQPQFNLLDRAGFEAELQPLCVREQIGVINFFGLARGFLTGKYRGEADLAKSPRGAGVQKAYFNERGWRVLAALDVVSARLGSTQAQVALAWQMRQPSIVAPIASATSLAQWDELAGAASLELGDDDLAELSRASLG